MSRKFETEYTRANDRIHPREDLLQELEQKWAAEETRRIEAEKKIKRFPTWARFAALAAGILLCVGLGMESMMLFGRSRSAKQEAAVQGVAAAGNAVLTEESQMAEEDAPILYEAVEADELEEAPAEIEAPETLMMNTATYEPPQGMHLALDEAEVENALLYGAADAGMDSLEREAAVPEVQMKSAETATEEAYPPGEVIFRDERMAVFLPTLEQVHVVQMNNLKVEHLFSLAIRERGVQIEKVLWLGDEFLAVRQRGDDTELVRIDATDFSAPKHLKNLTQSGAFLGAWEMNGRAYILSLYRATQEEPLPWVNGERLEYDRVLLDWERPGDAFAVLTIYEPGLGDGYAAAIALLSPIQGAMDSGNDRLLLWAQESDTTDVYLLSLGVHGLVLTAQGQVQGTVLGTGETGEGFSLMIQDGAEVSLMTVDATLRETARFAAQTEPIRWARVYEDGAVLLTASDMHFLTETGDHVLPVTGDAFCRLTPDRGLVLSADGQLQVVSMLSTGLEALGAAQVKGGLELLLEDLSRMAFDQATGRLVIPAGQSVYQYILDEAGKLTLRGETQIFYDHNETEQREIRVLLRENQALIFYKAGVAVCNQYLARQGTYKY